MLCPLRLLQSRSDSQDIENDASNVCGNRKRLVDGSGFSRGCIVNYIEELKAVILNLHGVEAEHVETVPVCEEFQGQTVWEGEVDSALIRGIAVNSLRRDLSGEVKEQWEKPKKTDSRD